MAKLDIDSKIREWVTQPRSYARDLLKIQTEEGTVIPFEFNEVQNLFFDILEDIKRRGKPIRVVIDKARRQGFTTSYSSRVFHRAVTRKNTNALMIVHDPESAEFVFGIHKRYYTNLPDPVRPATKYNTKKMLEFNTKDGKGLDSAIRVAAAGKEDIASGQMVNILHGSEVSKWPTHVTEAILTSVLQCVPNDNESEVVLESTAKGIGNEFHKRFLACRYEYEIYIDVEDNRKIKYRLLVNEDAPKESDWTRLFFPWFATKRYSMRIPEGFEMTPEEKELRDTHNLTPQQIAWYRWCLENKCGGDKRIRSQEFPSTWQESFLSSGSPVFDPLLISKLMSQCKPPVARYECQISTGQWISKPEGELRVWKEPEPSVAYVIGADVAEGLEKGDFSCADVINHLTGEQVAQWHGKIAPDIFAQILAALGRRYNTAWISCERNNHGITTILKMSDMGYPKQTVERVPDPPNKPRKRYGWLTSRSTKPMIIDNLAAELREGTAAIASKETFQEMLGFKRDKDGSFGADENQFDDRVMSLAIAKYQRTRIALPNMVRQRTQGWEPAQQTKQAPNIKAWI